MRRFNFNHSALGLLLIAALVAGSTQAEERHEDHEALRALLRTTTEALNTGNLDLVAPLLHKDFTIITVDNHKSTGLEEFKTYWESLFTGEEALIERIEVNAQADDLTRFLDEDTGVVHGTSRDTYHFSDGDVRVMQARWTALVQKEGGTWKLMKVHLSASLLNNPVLEAARAFTVKVGVAGLVVGFILGALLVFFLRGHRGRGPQAAHA